MRRLTTLFVTIGVAGVLVLGAVPVGAAVDGRVPAKTSKFCKAIRDFQIPEVSDDPDTREQAAATAKQLKKVAKRVKGKLRKASRTLAQVFERISDGDDFRDVLDARYVSASATFAAASLECLVGDTNLPDISLPDVSLPDISLPDISLPEE